MVMGLGEFALYVVIELLAGVIQEGVSYASLSYFQRRKIERRVEDAVAEVVEPLLSFLSVEGLSEDKQQRLMENHGLSILVVLMIVILCVRKQRSSTAMVLRSNTGLLVENYGQI